MKFCEQCSNLLEPKTFTGELVFHCRQCNKDFKSEPEDTLMFSFSKHKEKDKFNELIRGSTYDPTIKRIDRKCNNCGASHMGMLRLGHDEHIMFVCKCQDKGAELQPDIKY